MLRGPSASSWQWRGAGGSTAPTTNVRSRLVRSWALELLAVTSCVCEKQAVRSWLCEKHA
eukprot:996529-Lingulodinium_polyedra.AAC.1